MPVVAMFGSLFVTTGQSTGLCCGKSRRGNKNREGGTIHGQQINIKPQTARIWPQDRIDSPSCWS